MNTNSLDMMKRIVISRTMADYLVWNNALDWNYANMDTDMRDHDFMMNSIKKDNGEVMLKNGDKVAYCNSQWIVKVY